MSIVASGDLETIAMAIALPEVLERRQNNVLPNESSQSTSSTKTSASSPGPWAIVVGVLVALVVLISVLLLLVSYLRRLRLQNQKPGIIKGSFLERRWKQWKPKSRYASVDDGEEGSLHENRTETVETGSGAGNGTGAGVNRHTSVRSVISLPAYSKVPKDTEEVIGREGERNGMDVVVEFPENQHEEEARREEEMESLYQIRLQRRQEIAQREERRRQRREAREAGDFVRLDELRQESRARREENSTANATVTAEMMIAEHNARGRNRRVSEVTYGSLGQVRHDGSRLRAHSGDESERGGLLKGAAPMGSHGRQGSEAPSMSSINELSLPGMGRDRANSAATSVSSAGSFEDVSHQDARARNTDEAHSLSDVSSEEVDITTERPEPISVLPGTSPVPPRYSGHDWGDAPKYEDLSRRNSLASRAGSVRRQSYLNRAPRIPSMNLETPTINIQIPTQPNTPVVGRGEGPRITIPEDDEREEDHAAQEIHSPL